MVHVRAAQQKDREAVMALWEGSALELPTANEWRSVTGGDCARLMVADDNGEVVGAFIAAFDGWRAFVYHVAVLPERRHRGIGAQLMADAEKLLRGNGARRVFALVNAENTGGCALCVRSGFEREGDIAFFKDVG